MKKILYVFDDINYESGARNATLYQMKCLSEKYAIKVLSLSKPENGILEDGWLLETDKVWNRAEIFVKSFSAVMKGNYSFKSKMLRVLYAFILRLGKEDLFFNQVLYKEVIPCMENFDTVIVVSEASKIRNAVSLLKNPQKIQWIHTDYKLWSDFSDWTRTVTRNDRDIYERFDHIVTLTEINKCGLLEKIPSLEGKVCVIPNLVDIQNIRKKALEKTDIDIPNRKCKFITVGRIDQEKNFEGILDICKRLADEAVDYRWVIIGDGPLFCSIQKKVQEFRLENYVFMIGRQLNPYPWMKASDYLVLLSKYEGTPVTIDEAAALGILVISTAVGGIPEQIERYQNGTLIWNLEKAYEVIRSAIFTNIPRREGDLLEEVNRETLRKILQIL